MSLEALLKYCTIGYLPQINYADLHLQNHEWTYSIVPLDVVRIVVCTIRFFLLVGPGFKDRIVLVTISWFHWTLANLIQPRSPCCWPCGQLGWIREDQRRSADPGRDWLTCHGHQWLIFLTFWGQQWGLLMALIWPYCHCNTHLSFSCTLFYSVSFFFTLLLYCGWIL